MTHWQGYPLSTEASWINYHMADAVVAPAELWPALYSEASLLMPCSYHLNGHSVHQGQPPPRINSLMVEGGLDGKGYRCPAAIHEMPWMRTEFLPCMYQEKTFKPIYFLMCLQLSKGADGRMRVPSPCQSGSRVTVHMGPNRAVASIGHPLDNLL